MGNPDSHNISRDPCDAAAVLPDAIRAAVRWFGGPLCQPHIRINFYGYSLLAGLYKISDTTPARGPRRKAPRQPPLAYGTAPLVRYPPYRTRGVSHLSPVQRQYREHELCLRTGGLRCRRGAEKMDADAGPRGKRSFYILMKLRVQPPPPFFYRNPSGSLQIVLRTPPHSATRSFPDAETHLCRLL